MRAFRLAAAACLVTLIAAPAGSTYAKSSKTASNAVIDWSVIVQQAIHNPAAPRSVPLAQILHTTVQLAVYDAVVAIKGGYKPYASKIDAPWGADVRAAVAAAAYRTARARVAPSQHQYLDDQYALYLAAIPDGRGKSRGIQVGEAAASAILALRTNDGFDNVVLYECSATPVPVGEFEPNGGCGVQPVGASTPQIRPFALDHAAQYAPDGPPALTSAAYAADFAETRDYGRANSTVRTAEQTDISYFWSEHTYAHWSRNLNALARAKRLSVLEAARFLAMVHTAASDAVIAGFESKYLHRFWRPRTAIPRAAEDGNPATEADPAWTPLLQVNHPEYPSGHSFWTAAVVHAVAQFFGTTRVRWTLETPQAAVPQVVKTKRTYRDLNDLRDEVTNARIWSGLHWRSSMRDGSRLGERVARRVLRHHFRPAWWW